MMTAQASETKMSNEPKTTKAEDAIITVRNLSKYFDDFEALRDISLDVKRSEVLCLIGPSGSGKSTLLRCLNFLEQI